MNIFKEMWEENPYLTSIMIVFVFMILLAVATMVFVDDEKLPDSVLLEVQSREHIALMQVQQAKHASQTATAMAQIDLLQALLKDRTEQLMMCRESQ